MPQSFRIRLAHDRGLGGITRGQLGSVVPVPLNALTPAHPALSPAAFPADGDSPISTAGKCQRAAAKCGQYYRTHTQNLFALHTRLGSRRKIPIPVETATDSGLLEKPNKNRAVNKMLATAL